MFFSPEKAKLLMDYEPKYDVYESLQTTAAWWKENCKKYIWFHDF